MVEDYQVFLPDGQLLLLEHTDPAAGGKQAQLKRSITVPSALLQSQLLCLSHRCRNLDRPAESELLGNP